MDFESSLHFRGTRAFWDEWRLRLQCKGDDAAVHAQLFEIEAQIRDMDRGGINIFCGSSYPKRSDDCAVRFNCVHACKRGFGVCTDSPETTCADLSKRDCHVSNL